MRKFKKFFIFSVLIYLNFSFVLAENEKVEIKSGTNKFENLIFSVPQGSQHTGELLISNQGNENLNLVLFISPDEKTSLVEAIKKKNGVDLFFNTFFYLDVPPSKYQEELKNNGGEIAILCAKYKNSQDKAIKNWCKGTKMVTLSLNKNESKKIPFTISISAKAEEHRAFISAILEKDKENKILTQTQLTYKIPQLEIKEERNETENFKFKSFSFQKSFSFFDFLDWWKIGRREEYIANFSISSNKKPDLPTETFVKIESTFFNEEKFSSNLITKLGENQSNLRIKMPFFGKVKVIGGIKISENDKQQEFLTEELNFFMFPIREIVFFLILMLTILFLMWRKKKKLTNFLNSEKWIKYKIKKGDNIINLAYLYGISWKELVNLNQIKPPYTLTSGNVIMVPSRLKKVFKHTFMQNKNYYEDQNKSSDLNNEHKELENYSSNHQNPANNNPVHKTSFSVNSNIIEETEDSDSIQIPMSNSVPQRIYPERKFVDNVRSNMRNPIRQSFPHKNNFNQETSSNPDNFSANPTIENESVQENSTSENLTRNRDLVILPRFIVNKTMAERNNNLPQRKNMDIRWMHENNENYDEAMYEEVKAVNFKIKMILLIIIIILALLGYWIFGYFKNNNSTENSASINELITKNQTNLDQKKTETDQKKEVENKNEKTESNPTNPDLTNPSTPKTEVTKKPEEISVQVLNGGAKSGVATEITNIFKTKGYSTKTPSNAKNNVTGVIIYYNSSLKKEITELSKNISSTYGELKLEESDEVSQKYKVDIIIVAGK